MKYQNIHYYAIAFLFLIAVIPVKTLKAQSEFGVKGGILFSNIKAVDNNSNIEFEKKDGLSVGAFYKKRNLFGPVGFQTELLYQMKGANVFMEKYEILPDNGGSRIEMSGAYYRDKEQLHYFTLPLLLTVRTTKFLDLYGGPELGYLFSFKNDRQESGNLNRFSAGVALGATLKLCENTHLDFRYSTDFTRFDTLGKISSIDLKNNGFAITIQQTLFRKPAK